MKKLMLMFAISCLVLVMAGSIFACDPASVEGKVGKFHQPLKLDYDLNAIVHAYARLDVIDADLLLFDGNEKQEKEGDLKFILWNNDDVTVTGKGDDFGMTYKDRKYYELETTYSIQDCGGRRGWGWGYDREQKFEFAYPGKDKFNEGKVHYKAETGRFITSQPAGEYKATYTFTVSSDWYCCKCGRW